MDTPHRLVALGVRLFAIWFAVGAVHTIILFVVGGAGRRGALAAEVSFGLALVMLLIALALWRFPLIVARRLLPSAAPQAKPTVAADTWLAMGCSLLGLWLIVTAVPSFLRDASSAYWVSHAGGEAVFLGPWFVQFGAQVVLGLWLSVGAKGFRRLFWWVQNAGIRRTR